MAIGTKELASSELDTFDDEKLVAETPGATFTRSNRLNRRPGMSLM